MDGIAGRMCAAVGLALVGVLCAAAPALATDGKVTGTKWHDLDADGVKEAGEPVLKDWLIYLDTNRDGDYDSGEPAAKTDASGNYAITGIRWWWDQHKPKTYDVREKPVAQQPQDLDRCSYPADCKHTLTFSYQSHIYGGKNFGNYKSGKIVVKKVNVGGTQTDTFSFTSAKLGNFSMAAGQKEFASLAPGSYSVAEQPAAGYALASASCDDGSTPAEIKLASGETVTCTFTNTRTYGQIKVVKKLVPSTDGGSFDLKVNGNKVVSGGDGATATVAVPTGSGHSVAETGATLAKYSSSVSCSDGSTGATSASGITVKAGETTVCTFTNTRKTGTIKVVKRLVPAADSGRFDLAVGGQVVADGAGDGGSGTRQVAPGAYTVSESGDGATDLAGYSAAVECRRDGQVVKAGSGTSLGGVAVDSGELVVCTFTNTRKAKLTLTKTEGGASDLSHDWHFVLRGQGAELTRSTADGPVDFGHLLPGAYTLCEVDLPDGWISSLGPAVNGAACIELTLANGDTKTIAIDNIRPQIELLKQVRRAGDAGWAKEATLQVGQKAEYLLTVTNPGVGPLVDLVVLDDRCDAAPLYAAGDTDADGELDESEAWTYRCDHVVTAADGARYVNTATADAADKRGNPVRDSDTATVTVTTPEPPKQPEPPRTPPGTPSTPPAVTPPAQQQTLPAKIVSGTARMRGPSGCTRRPFEAKVTGRRIARVTFWLDGKRVKRVVAKRGRKAFALKVDPRRVARGVHRVTARVVFAASSETAPRTLRLSFQRCARQVTTPQFTG